MDKTKEFMGFLDKMQGLLENAKKQGHIIVRIEDIENTFPELKREREFNGVIVEEDFNEGDGFYKMSLAYLSAEQVAEIEGLVGSWNLQPKGNEDESIIGDLLDYFDEDKCLKHEVNDIVKWLKTIKLQQKGWSEEDEQIALSIAQVMNCAALLNIVPEKISKIRIWLQSLKQRVIWGTK